MNRKAFIDAYRHELSGMILDAATMKAEGPALSLFVRTLLHKVDSKLGEMYDALHREADPKPATLLNGAAHPAKAK